MMPLLVEVLYEKTRMIFSLPQADLLLKMLSLVGTLRRIIRTAESLPQRQMTREHTPLKLVPTSRYRLFQLRCNFLTCNQMTKMSLPSSEMLLQVGVDLQSIAPTKNSL